MLANAVAGCALSFLRSGRSSDVNEPDGDSTQNQKRQRDIVSGLRLVSLLTVFSRITGLVRDSLMAAMFGNGPIMDAFSVAFRLPNMARRLFGEGALTAAFLPAMVRETELRGRESAWRLASALFMVLAVVLLAIVGLSEIVLLSLRAFAESADAKLLLGLAAVMVPYLIVICLAAQVAAVMHSMDHFKWPAFVSVLLNATWIVGILLVEPLVESQTGRIYAISAVVVVGGCLQLLVPLPALFRLGFRFDRNWFRKSNPARDDTIAGVRSIGRTMMPVLLGLSVTQFNSVLDSLLAWWFASDTAPASQLFVVESGTAAALYLGQRMYQFPLGVFGIALGTVLFPRLSRHAERNQDDAFRDDLVMGLRLVICVAIPASVGLCLLAEPLTRVLFQRGAFDEGDVGQTVSMIRGYGSAVWAYCGLLIMTRAFYAMDDQKTPLRIGVAAMLLNVALNFLLLAVLGGIGLAIATAITCSIQVFVVLWYLRQKIGTIDFGSCVISLGKAMLATGVMTIACLAVLYSLPNSKTTLVQSTRLFGPFAASLAAYWCMSRVLRMHEINMLLDHSNRAAVGDE